VNRFIGVPRLLVAVATVGTIALAAAGPAMAGSGASSGGTASAGYNSIPSKVSGNVPSLSFEGAPADEFGDEVALGGKARTLESMSVLLSSWGCESGGWSTNDCQTTPGATFAVPITFTIYTDDNGTAGAVLARTTPTVTVPYRPSASSQCAGADAGKWYNSKDRTCYNGLPYLASVDLSSLGVSLPDQVIWSVQYNTTTSGYTPVGAATCTTEPGGCGYDSLNVGAYSYPKAPFAGTDVNDDDVFYDGVMQAEWTGYRPLGTISTS
jgi:hypothetical protein